MLSENRATPAPYRIHENELPALQWKGRTKSLRWGCHADGSQLKLDLVDAASRITTTVSAFLPGWLCNEDDLVLRSAGYVNALALAGVIESRTVALAGTDGCVIARLTPATRRALQSVTLDIA